MEYSQVLENARKNIGPNCKVCPVCNGLGCGHTMPGPGSKAPGTAEVLPEIVEAVKGKTKIMIDGGIRSGLDVFKALAMGADMCLICRPVLISYYGGGQEGIECYLDKIQQELSDTMYMCGARRISDINGKMIRIC